MKKHLSLFTKTSLTALIPLGTAGMSFMTEKFLCFLSNIWEAETNQHQQGNLEGQELANGSLDPVIFLFQQFRKLLLSVYNTYPGFLALMMLFHLIVHLSKDLIKQITTKKDDHSRDFQASGLTGKQMKLKALDMLTLLFHITISFYLFKFLMLIYSTYLVNIALNPSHPSTTPSLKASQIFALHRNLVQEDEEEAHRMLIPQRPLFLKVMNEVYLDDLFPLHTVFSKDVRTAFEVQGNGLGVYNLSDPAAPQKISTFNTTITSFPSAVLSPKGRTLFLDADDLQLINVTDLGDLRLLSSIQFRTEEEITANIFRHHPTVAVSSDEKYAICSDPRMNIYDVSDLESPRLVRSESWKATSVLLSADDQIAFIGSEGSLEIWNVTDFESPRRITSFPVLGTVLTSALSNDELTIYVLCFAKSQDPQQASAAALVLHIIDIEDLLQPELQSQLSLSQTQDLILTSLMVSSDGTFLVLKSSQSLRIINLRDFDIINLMDDALYFPTMAFLPNGKNAVLFSVGMVRFAEVYFDITYDQSSSLQPHYLAHLTWQSLVPKQIAVARSIKKVFILVNNPADPNHKLLLSVNLQDYLQPFIDGTFSLASSVDMFLISPDGKKIYYKSKEKTLQILNTQDGAEAGALEFQENFEQMFIVSSDQRVLFTLQRNSSHFSEISIRDISDPSFAKTLSGITIQSDDNPQGSSSSLSESITSMVLSADEKSLFYLNQALYIIDVSDKTYPRLVNNFNFGKYLTKTFAFSPNYRTCFVIATTSFLNKKILFAIDLKDYNSPKVLSMMDLPVDTNYKLTVSADDKFLFVTTSDAFITLDISDKTAIKISEAQSMKVSSFILIRGDQNILVANENGFVVLNRKARYALYSSKHQFTLGKTYSNTLKILELNQYNNNYSSIGQNYKFIQASLYTPEIKPLNKFLVSYPILPTWIDFDKDNAVLDIDLTQAVNVTSHQICFKASTQVSQEIFLQIQNANFTKVDVQNLQAYLVGQGYLDSEQFLTPNFDDNTPLVLNTQYSSFELDIRKILRAHGIELITTISIESSLKLIRSNPLKIVTPSLGSVTVTIELASSSAAQTKFVTKAFSAVKVSLNEKKTLLVLEGALLNINEALKEVLINLEQENSPSEATVIVSDSLNPKMSYHLRRLADHVVINQYPQMVEKYSVQSQVEKIPVTSGQHFNIEFDEGTFIDLNDRPLTYTLEMADEKMEVPSWIVLRRRNLMGTPPDEFWPYKKEFSIKVSNEYKSVAIDFTLKVGLSPYTVLKRILYVIGYLFTAYKSWKNSDKFYNIVFKKYYRYPKIFKVNTDRKVSENMIFPVLLVGRDVQGSSKAILKAIKENLGQEKRLKKNELIEHLVDPDNGSISRQRLIEEIEKVMFRGPIIGKKGLVEYKDKDNSHKLSVQNLIINELTMRRLKFKEEKKTLEIYEKIKTKWIDLVDMDHNTSQFFIKNKNLAHVLQSYGINITELLSQAETAEEEFESLSGLTVSSASKASMEKELILSKVSEKDSSKINIGLLKDAILAYAFDRQNVYATRNQIFIQSRELIASDQGSKGRLRRFLKLDMVGLVQSSTKELGYGLKYKIVGNKVIFYGKLEDEIKSRTVVVQIVSKRGWILKEFFIQDAANQLHHRSTIIDFVNIEL